MNTTFKIRKTLPQANAIFLTLVGGVAGVANYVGYRTGLGPLGPILHNNAAAVGKQEAHGLACLFGLTLFIYAVSDMRPSRHLLCAGIHILLGGSNILYWNGAVEYGIVGPEIVVTTIHGLLAMCHLVFYFLANNAQGLIRFQSGI